MKLLQRLFYRYSENLEAGLEAIEVLQKELGLE